MIIRRYDLKDVNEVLDLHIVAMKNIGAYKGEGPWDDDLKNIEDTYINNKGEFLVGVLNGKIIAMGAFKKIDNATAEIKRMRVYPEYQGNGYGKMILNKLYKIAINNNYKYFILETSTIQLYAQKLYENFGFKEFKREKIDGFDCIWYKMALT